jgi:protein-L-isoaspartate(D-aspartate) O-methyltransferase
MFDFARARQNMVDGQIRPSSVTDWRIIDAMRLVPREAFLPDSRRAMAYLDLDIDVGAGHFLLNPTVTARLLQAADLQPNEHVLVVGCADGYAAALAAKLAAKVTATVDDDTLAGQATAAIQSLGLGNVTVRVAPAADGCAADGPYDAILLNGATEIVPERLYQQLKIGGRLVGAFATQQPQRATVVTRSHADFGSRILFDTSVPVLPGLQRAPAFVF